MLKYLAIYVVVAITMLVLDMVWLRGIAAAWYFSIRDLLLNTSWGLGEHR